MISTTQLARLEAVEALELGHDRRSRAGVDSIAVEERLVVADADPGFRQSGR